MDEKTGHELTVHACSPKIHLCSGQKQHGQQGKRGDYLSPQFHSHEILPTVLHSTLGPPVHEGQGAVRVGSETTMRMIREVKHLS